MPELTTGDIAGMRTTLEESLPSTAVIQAGTVVSDSGGGGTTTWNAAGTVACRLSPISGNEREIASRIAEDATWVVTLPAETAVTNRSRIVVDGVSFEVLTVRAPRSWEISRRVEVSEVA